MFQVLFPTNPVVHC